MKKEERDKLKSMNTKQLMEKLEELQKERNKLETYMRKNDGTSVVVRNYPKARGETPYKMGNLREIKKNIARVKTWLNVKMVKQ